MSEAAPSAPAPVAGLGERFSAWRNRLLASRRFQAWAAAFPLTRPLARRKAADLFQLCTGFVHTQILLACVEIDVFRTLQAGPLPLEAIATRAGLPEDGAERLLKGAASLGLLERRGDGRFALGELGAALLGNPSVLAMIRHHGDLYKDLADPVALLRGRRSDTRLARFWSYARPDANAEKDGDVAPYSDLMADTQDFIADEILHAYDVRRHKRLMDVGGGAGAFLARAASVAPNLDLVLCDLPPVAELASARLHRNGLGARAKAVGCDMFKDTLPGGADLITLVRILHDHDDAPVSALLASARRALAPGGTLVIAEPMAGTPGAEAMGDAYFGLYLWAMGSGRPRRFEELGDMARAAGFTRIREARSRQPLLVRLLVAQ